jgi:hypothetical protein
MVIYLTRKKNLIIIIKMQKISNNPK